MPKRLYDCVESGGSVVAIKKLDLDDYIENRQ